MHSYRPKGEGLFYAPLRDLLHCIPRLLAIAASKAADTNPDKKKEIYQWVHELRIALNESKNPDEDLDFCLVPISKLMQRPSAGLVIPHLNMVILARYCLGARETSYAESITEESLNTIISYISARPFLPKRLAAKVDNILRKKVKYLDVVDTIPCYTRVEKIDKKEPSEPGGDLYEEILVKSILNHAYACGEPVEEVFDRLIDNTIGHKEAEEKEESSWGWFRNVLSWFLLKDKK